MKNSITEIEKTTMLTILFEGFYQSLQEKSKFKVKFRRLRQRRWSKHFGLPTATFLAAYHKEIEKIKSAFLSKGNFLNDLEIEGNGKVIDKINNVLVNLNILADTPIPIEIEKQGRFVKTHNPLGGFTATASDPFSQQFIMHAKKIGKGGGRVLEIGAAFGTAALQAAGKGVSVYCNDIDVFNLAVVHNRYMQLSASKHDRSVGNDDGLVLLPGSFPEELTALPKNYFDAILISRVLHFFTGEIIEESLKLLRRILKPDGKLYVVCESPYLKNWQSFIPEFEKKLAAGLKWPGEIYNTHEVESSGYVATLPNFMHWLSDAVLARALKAAKFAIEELSYINRKDQFPENVILDGRESVGAIAVKS